MFKWTDRVDFLKQALADEPDAKALTVSRRNLEVLIIMAERSVESQRNWENIKQFHRMEMHAMQQKIKAAEAKTEFYKEKAGVKK